MSRSLTRPKYAGMWNEWKEDYAESEASRRAEEGGRAHRRIAHMRSPPDAEKEKAGHLRVHLRLWHDYALRTTPLVSVSTMPSSVFSSMTERRGGDKMMLKPPSSDLIYLSLIFRHVSTFSFEDGFDR